MGSSKEGSFPSMTHSTNVYWAPTMCQSLSHYRANFSEVGFLNKGISPGWCGSVDWVLAWEPKGRWFDSRPGHMSGLRARSPVVGARETTTQQCFSPFLSPSLPLSLKINKNLLFKKAREKKLVTGRLPDVREEEENEWSEGLRSTNR